MPKSTRFMDRTISDLTVKEGLLVLTCYTLFKMTLGATLGVMQLTKKSKNKNLDLKK